MYKCLIISILTWFSCIVSVYAQAIPKEARNYLEEGKIYYDGANYLKALDSYLGAYKFVPNDPGVNYSIALCYIQTYSYDKALTYLIPAKKAGIKDPLLDYYMGLAYHANSNIDEALKSLTAFQSTLRSSDKELTAQTAKYITYCNNAKTLMLTPVKMTITNLGASVNSAYPDYNPAISVDESTIIYTSRRPNSTGGLISEMDGHYFEDIYMSNKQTNNSWGTSIQIDQTINTTSHDACVGLSSEGQTMIVYKDDGGGDLYYSNLSGQNWSKPISFGKAINTDGWEACGNFSPDGNYLFFVSNKKGGFGGTDIYYAVKNAAGVWGAPVNMGPEINTKEDEFSPYLHADGKTFYFSSQAHTSMGGFDIFQSTIDLSMQPIAVKSKPENLGYPINTVGDEIYFVWSADNKRAYFSSAREGGLGDKDLYLLERPVAKAALVLLKGTISDCKTKEFIQASITVTDIESGKLIGKYVSNSSTGKYIVTLPAGKNYSITVEAKGYLFHSKNINIPKLEEFKEIDDVICLDKIDIGTTIVLNNVFFDVNKSTLRKESETELDKLFDILSKNPKIKIEVAGHTDSDGDTQANLTLSDARAHTVKDYLIGKGISADRIIYVGHGEGKPVVPNDTPENKQLNRRTEIKILEN
ncbi:OmpA family protein [Cytophaga hutchinsonii]|uniref:Outer membrane protein, OmpA family n=1 Tax=Cytophaga hutchinsonii (strain ATCC 33406 / DSM 1761 / CIP 103989 / NBRC 15051 / NCIMB 9469 / D465) TaxID=269798 RepID=A0A6N4SR23_CYTH3|nr:OmpA family protein [Cytophaga hutchinsonii]ABG58832.1 outer membrane protein, OmpA family [Cytophaga hutchinsonii ATCC 33406]SFX80211.1 Outer membrane protein OmpA [Cytophaga hutchinsonii ATCC 33406]